MDARFLEYYNRELAYLRELGGEFAAAFPKVAGRLGMQGETVADPYVERLLEGFAFLSARIHIKIDAEFPRFSQRLLEVVYPHYLAPTPAMAIVRVENAMEEGGNADTSAGRLSRGTYMTSETISGGRTACTFVTAHDLDVWPLEILEVRADLPGDKLPPGALTGKKPVKGILRMRLKFTCPEAVLGRLPDRLCLHIAADEPDAGLLYEAVAGYGLGVVVSEAGGGKAQWLRAPETLRAEGFDAEQALLPTDARVFQGYRLLHEYFAFPARYLFFSIGGIGEALTRLGAETFEIAILLDRDPSMFASAVGKRCLLPNCVPIINLFPSSGKRLPITPGALEHHIVPDRTRPLDYEVYQVFGIDGFDRSNNAVRSFAPFYRHVGETSRVAEAFFSTRREPRRLSEQGGRDAGRSGYRGSEVFASLVDMREAPWPEQIEQIAVDMLLTNRDLPLFMPTGASLNVDTRLSLRRATVLKGPSRPRPQFAEREMTWRLISHLSINYLALRDLSAGSGAALLRELLGLYAALGDPVVGRQAESIVATHAKAVNRRLPVVGPLVFGRGVAMDVTLDERPFAGGSPYLFGAVLEQFLSRHVSMNMFCELNLFSTTRGKVASWPPRWGGRPDA
ncbi:MAG: type VI secretion system baseplate subunit TssF [Zoogloeaceae bacterium]|jgi:type VI secretion system protein ImpG|nr:type VI secretion system baseplate subunit TssF [Zoogloeaceae bacterium]